MLPHIHVQFPDPNSPQGTLHLVGTDRKYPCIGHLGCNYPMECVVTPAHKKQHIELQHPQHEEEESNAKSNQPMTHPYTISIDESRGIYMHEGSTNTDGQLINEQAGTGCIELAKGDAQQVYDFIEGRTKLSISHGWEFKFSG